MFTKFTLCLVAMTLAVLTAPAQSPAPIVVQAIVPNAAAATSAPIAPGPATGESPLRALQQIKAANEEILRKQAATLQQLEEMEKAAEQIKIYTKRG